MSKEDIKEVKDEIEINDPRIVKPEDLPLVVKLPKTASLAQIEYAKVINSYAYQNPSKFAGKKDNMIKKLKSLKNAPDPVPSNMTIGGTSI